ncbi:hypothetical protein D3C71_20500 [compost metagenome]
MHSDFAVLTGAHHTSGAKACQDFCLAETTGERAWALVADGCSTGGLSDLGARAWSLAGRKLLRGLETLETDPQRLTASLLELAGPSLDDLAFEDGFSTLALLQVQGSRVHASFFGDGALLARHLDGSMTLVNLQYTLSAPCYLNYLRHDEARRRWLAEYGRQELLVTVNRYDREGELVGLTNRAQAASEPWQWEGDVEADELELVLVATDGVSSRSEGFVATGKALLAVKSSTGEFLRRRLSRAARDWAAAGAMPADDLAAAGVWLGRESADG